MKHRVIKLAANSCLPADLLKSISLLHSSRKDFAIQGWWDTTSCLKVSLHYRAKWVGLLIFKPCRNRNTVMARYGTPGMRNYAYWRKCYHDLKTKT